MLTAQNLKKIYSQGDTKVHALNDVSLTINKGEFTSIMGPSGSGKSTLLHLLGGLDKPTQGKILIDNEDIAKLSDQELSRFRRRRLGFIFQFFNLLPTMTALENVALPLLLDGKSLDEVRDRASKLLSELGLSKRQDHTPDQLSGGEMQRVAICRALVTDPVVILADEPTGNLDSKTGHTVLEILASLAKDKGQTILMVTHSQEAADFGDKHIVMRDGKIISHA